MSRKKKGRKNIVRKEVKTESRPVTPTKKSPISIHWLMLFVIMLAVTIIRMGLLNIPLERDEGEYAYIGNQITEGIFPYVEAYNMKLPGTYVMYALIMSVFGKSTAGIHGGLLFISLVSIVFLYLGVKKLFSPWIALFTAGAFGIMATSNAYFGFAAHATHFVAFFTSIALYFLACYFENKKLLFSFLTGLMFGLAFLMKQHAVFFILFGGISVLVPYIQQRPLVYRKILQRASVYSAGAVIPYIITMILIKMSGAFDRFWFWTVEYASKYASGLSFDQGRQRFASYFKPMWNQFTLFWLLFFASLILLFFTRFSRWKKAVAGLFILFAFLTICPGFYFRQHYFISFLPAVALGAALSLNFLAGLMEKNTRMPVAAILFTGVLGIGTVAVLTGNKTYYGEKDKDRISKNIYTGNPFVESVVVADYLKRNTTPEDKIGILGSEPEILFYADRRSATGYIYMYSFMEIHKYNLKMQEEMIAEMEKSQPKYIVFCSSPTSWLSSEESPRRIFEWANQFINQYYILCGVADMIDPYSTVYKWEDEARNYQPKGTDRLTIFRRKS